MSKKNLSKAVVLSLLLGSACGVAQAENIVTAPSAYQGAGPDGKWDGVNVTLSEKNYYSSATAAGVRSNRQFIVDNKDGNVFVLVDNTDTTVTNNALFVQNDKDTDKSTADITAKTVFFGSIYATKADAISAKNGGTAIINPTPESGGYTRVIGDIDFVENDLHHDWVYYNNKKNKPELTADGNIELTLNNDKSFWYGDEENTYPEFKDEDKTFASWDEFAEQYPQYADYLIEKTVYGGKTTEERMKKLEDIKISGHGDLKLTVSNGAEWIYKMNPTISKITLEKGGIINEPLPVKRTMK